MEGWKHLWSDRAALLASVFADAGREIRLVGGIVRDAVCGYQAADQDLCTDASAAEMIEVGFRAGLRTIPTRDELLARPSAWDKGGLRHGTVPFLVGGEPMDVTSIGSVGFRANAGRRDLTINAMGVDANGILHDYHGGRDDLSTGTVRFVGDADQRLAEDPLRILRYHRFRARHAWLGGVAVPQDVAAAAAVARNAGSLGRVAGERIWSEVSKMLSHPRGVSEASRMLPAVAEAACLPACSDTARERAILASGRGAPPVVTLAFMAGDDAVLDTAAARWKLGARDVASAKLARHLCGLPDADLAYFAGLAIQPRGDAATVAACLRAMGRPGDAETVAVMAGRFPVTGADIVAAGIAPGPGVGDALARLRTLWLEMDRKPGKNDLIATLAVNPGIYPSYRR